MMVLVQFAENSVSEYCVSNFEVVFKHFFLKTVINYNLRMLEMSVRCPPPPPTPVRNLYQCDTWVPRREHI